MAQRKLFEDGNSSTAPAQLVGGSQANDAGPDHDVVEFAASVGSCRLRANHTKVPFPICRRTVTWGVTPGGRSESAQYTPVADSDSVSKTVTAATVPQLISDD